MSKHTEALEAARGKYRDALEALANAPDTLTEDDLDALEEAVGVAKDEMDEAERVAGNYAKRDAARDLLTKMPQPVAPAEPQTTTQPTTEVRVGQEPLTYGRERRGIDAKHSFLQDMLKASPPAGRTPDVAAAERLARHSKEMAVETRDSTTTDTTSIGEMIPPMWMVDQFAAIARAGRPLANYLGSRDLPVGTDQIIVPKVTTGGSVHFQTAQNTAIAEQDMVTGGTAQAVVKTIAGQIDTSLQSVEWAPLNMVDGFFLPELASLHAYIFENQVGQANNTNGAWQGIIGTSGTQTVTYTAASPTAGSLYSKVADGIQQIHTNRFLPPNLIVMHPRRWASLLAASDTTGRPLVVPLAAQGPYNNPATQDAVASEGVVGTMQGLPVLVSSAAIPTNDASGTTNDVVLVMRSEDQWIWESAIRTRVLYEVLSGALSVRIQLYNYSATMFDRYPKSISAVRGTGLSTPSF